MPSWPSPVGMNSYINIFTIFDKHHISLKIHSCFPPTCSCLFLLVIYIFFAIYLSLSSSHEFSQEHKEVD